jgi:hypothetical protein
MSQKSTQSSTQEAVGFLTHCVSTGVGCYQKKMDKLTNQVIDLITDGIKSKIEEVKQNCDSPIEEILLMFLLKAFLDKNKSDLVFLTDNVDTTGVYPEIDDEMRRKKFEYPRLVDGFLNRISGFQFRPRYILLGSIGDKDTWISRFNQDFDEKIVIEPQHMVTIDNSETFFIDIAVYTKIFLRKDKKTVFENKIAIECDGHDYHSTKPQITRDNKRTRKLIKEGWSVLRYSGSEIYKESKTELIEVTNEVLKIFNQKK